MCYLRNIKDKDYIEKSKFRWITSTSKSLLHTLYGHMQGGAKLQQRGLLQNLKRKRPTNDMQAHPLQSGWLKETETSDIYTRRLRPKFRRWRIWILDTHSMLEVAMNKMAFQMCYVAMNKMAFQIKGSVLSFKWRRSHGLQVMRHAAMPMIFSSTLNLPTFFFFLCFLPGLHVTFGG